MKNYGASCLHFQTAACLFLTVMLTYEHIIYICALDTNVFSEFILCVFIFNTL